MSDIFREIEDELRRESLLRLWSRYSRYIIAGAVLIVLIAVGVVAWRQHLASERLAQANHYTAAEALAREGKDAEAEKVFAEVANDGGGYGLPAGFQQAALLAKAGDRQGAIAAYDRLAASSSIAREYRDLAVLFAVMHQPPDGDSHAAIERLAPLTENGNPWRATALDVTAAAKLKSGDRGGALEIYQKLADDLAAPRESARPRRRNGRGTEVLAGAPRASRCPYESSMNRRDFTALLLASAAAGCGIFDEKKTPLPGERISVLGLGGGLEADPSLAEVAVALPPPELNPAWPVPGGVPTHAMGHPALPEQLSRAWSTDIGEGASRYTRILSAPVVAGGRVFAMDGATQVSALDAASGRPYLGGRSKARRRTRQRVRRRPVLLERSAVRDHRIRSGGGARSGRRKGHLAPERHGAAARAADRYRRPRLRGQCRERARCAVGR